MFSWVLILTLMYNGNVIITIPNFENYETCRKAGETWRATERVGVATYSCVSTQANVS